MKSNKVLNTITELVFTLSATAMVFSSRGINYFFLGSVVLFLILILTQNKIMGILLGVLTLILSLFMMIAVLFEFKEFSTVDSEALALIGAGMLLFLTTLLCSVFMLKKYTSKTTKSDKPDNPQASYAIL